MSEKKHKVDVEETQTTKHKNDEERISGFQPADVLRQVKNGPPSALKPAKIIALQRTVGNRVVQRLITKQSQPGAVQRHVSPETTAAYNEHFPAANADWDLIGQSVRAARDKLSEARDQGGPFVAHENAIQQHAFASIDYEGEGGGSESEQAEGGG